MTIIFLIRHGSNDYIGKRLAGRTAGVHLNEEGINQAENLTTVLGNYPFKAIYSSPLERTVETAQPLSKAKSLPVLINGSLIEVDFGDWTGMTRQEMENQPLWRTVQDDPANMRFPGGESFIEAQKRISRGLEVIVQAHGSHEMVACFSHSDAIKLAITAALDLPINSFQRLIVNPASVSILNFTSNSSYLVCLNWHHALDNSLPPFESSVNTDT